MNEAASAASHEGVGLGRLPPRGRAVQRSIAFVGIRYGVVFRLMFTSAWEQLFASLGPTLQWRQSGSQTVLFFASLHVCFSLRCIPRLTAI